jgi:hypothetical protein
MIQLVLLLSIACTLLVVVILLLRDAGRTRAAWGNEDPHRYAGPPVLHAEIPSRDLMDRIFAADDLRFVSCERVAGIKRQFLRDRRRIALSWLSQTRREATRILQVHLHAVRTDLALQPGVELQLLLHVLLFFAFYLVLWSLVSCYGAFWARSLMRNVVDLAARLSGLGTSILADADRSILRMAQSNGHA